MISSMELSQREELFEFYEGFDSPILNITLNLEVKNILPRLKEKEISFFQYFVYALCKSISEVDNFNYRFDGSKIYKTKRLIPSYTVLRETGLFNFCTFLYEQNWENFLKKSLEAKNIAEKSKKLCHDDMTHKDYVFITCLPWLNFTSVQHPVGRFKDSTIPSFAIGKYKVSPCSIEGEKVIIPLSVQAHHGLVDGVHISQLVEKLKINLVKIP